MRIFAATVAAVAAAFLATTTAAPSTERTDALDRGGAALSTVTLDSIHVLRASTWACESSAELPRSRAAPDSEIERAGIRYRLWVITRWASRLTMCREIGTRTLSHTADWMTAVRVVQRAWPGSGPWLDACSGSEGGHGPWKFRDDVGELTAARRKRPPNVPGGPMQYFQSTFWGDYRGALDDLDRIGLRAPPSSASWFSPLGQAIAAGWAYEHARPSGKWTGGSC